MTNRLHPLLLAAFVAVLATTPAHARVTAFGGAGTGPGQFGGVSSVALASDGNVLVGERGNVRVQKVTPTGAPLLQFGSRGSDPGQFGGTSDGMPLWATGGPDGSIYVGDPGTETVSRFDAAGQFLNRWPVGQSWTGGSTLSRPQVVEVDEAGDVYVVVAAGVQRYSAAGALEAEWATTDAQGRFVEVRDLAVRNGRAYVLGGYDWSVVAVTVYTPDGALIERWPDTGLAWAFGLAADAGSRVYISGPRRIDQFDAHGALLGSYAPQFAGADRDENFCQPGPFTEDRFDPARMSFGFGDLAIDASGAVYVLEQQGDMVWRIEQRPDVRVRIGPQIDRGGSIVRRTTGQHIILDAGRSNSPFGGVPNHYEWDLDGDGDFELDTGTDSRVTTAYATGGDRLVRLRVSEPGGGSAVHEVPLRIEESEAVLTPRQLVAGRPERLSPDDWRMFCSKALKYEWDLDGDGTFEVDNGDRAELEATIPSPGQRRISIRITRPGGREDVASAVYPVAPEPPPGPVGVSIEKGALFTNSPRVTVNPVWAPPTARLYLSNDGGFGVNRAFGVAPAVEWKLDSSGPERLPKTVYLRFDNLQSGATYQDDIILDETRPLVTHVAVLGSGARASARPRLRQVRIRANDNVSGVARMQVTGDRNRPGRWRKFARRASVRTSASGVWVRVRDRAGNRSRWRRSGA